MKLEDELKMEKFRTEFQRAFLNIIFTAYWLEDQNNELFKSYDISMQQYNVLRILRGQKGKPANLFLIQDRMIHKMSNATRLVEKLRLKGYVKRVTCEENRRKVEITITDKGLQLLEELEPKMKKSEADISANITDKEAAQLGRLLDKLRG
ncbi:MAG: winged helix DNA-binding protein [Bacteroidetes bacterium]|nr:winged helix DNA-binding protein [Bacteroidota bacterium]